MKRKGTEVPALKQLVWVMLALATFAVLLWIVIFLWNNGVFGLIQFLISMFITGMNQLPVPAIFPSA